MLAQSKSFCSYSVNDLQTAKKFYSDILGLTVKDNPMGVIEVELPQGPGVMLYPKPNHEPATFTVLNFKVSQLEPLVDELIAKGIVFEQYDDPIRTDAKGICRNGEGPSAIAWFKDPAGNILSVIQE